MPNPILIGGKELRKSYGARPLFEGVTFTVEEGDRIGMIGPNGAGKSTLLKILAGKTSADGGEITSRRGLKVGFLEQTPVLPADAVIESYVQESADLALAGEILSKLDLAKIGKQTIGTLSGGWQKRVALARELVKSPDVLLLDEPTNHLDIDSILWLETFLTQATFATMTVTHDRLFLQRVSRRIFELDRRNPGGLLIVQGDYATYLERKEALMLAQEKRETALTNTLRRETEWLRQGAKARTTKQQARISAAERLKDEVEELAYRNQTKKARLDFQSVEKNPKRLIEAKKITKSYGQRDLFRDYDVFIGPGSRIGLLGSNGCGKSTLIRLLLGEEEPDSGVVYRSDNLKVAYFEQNRETLNPQNSLRKEVCPHGDHVNYRGNQVHIVGYLERFLFRKEQADVAVSALSGGEQARILIAKLMLKESNLLVLDEPTNDLDVATLDVLQQCLVDFDGGVVLVTHDRYFLDQVATQIESFPGEEGTSGKIETFAGLHQWENWRKEKLAEKRRMAKKESPTPTAAPSSKKRKLSFNEAREFAAMEAKVEAAEKKLADLESESQLPETISNSGRLSQIFQDIATTQQDLDKLYARWAELEAIEKG